MQTHRSVDVVIAFGREEKKFDRAGRLPPLISDDRLHHISLGLLVFGQHGGGSVSCFQPFACVIEELLISDEVPAGLLVLKLDFDKVLLVAEVKNCPFESRLDQAFDRPGLAALDHCLFNDLSAGVADHFRDLFLSFGPMKAEGRADLLRIGRLNVCKAKQSGHKP